MRSIFLCVTLLVLNSSISTAGTFLQQTVSTSDGDRTFWLYMPVQLPDPEAPVVFVFHGDGGTAENIAATTGFNALADVHKFIVVYPQAAMVGGSVRFNTYIDQQPGNAGLGVAQCVDDVEFTNAIITLLSSIYDLNVTRVYATGHSGGGFMCYNLALQLRQRITAIAPVSANMWGDDAFITQKLTSDAWTTLPVMHIHGTADPVVDYPDKDRTPKAYEEWPLPAFSVSACGANTYTSQEAYVGATKYIFCNGANPVWLIGIDGMGHTWTNGTFPTTTVIATFFNLLQPTSVNENRLEIDPAEIVNVYDITGAIVLTTAMHNVHSAGLSSGVYCIANADKTIVKALLLAN